MKRLVNLFLIIFFFLWSPSGMIAGHVGNNGKGLKETSLNDMRELHVRGGLPNFFAKANQVRHLHIGYLGGSITAAADGWRELTYNWFRVQYPQVVITHTNGGIGGTGSGLGAFRTESDILCDSPDLIFVEFAVNDGGQPIENVQRTMEGIVRKIWTLSPETDICFVYTVDESKCNALMNGKLDDAVKAMETVAEQYSIPSIHLGIEVAKLQKTGKLVFTADPSENDRRIVFTKDHVHPLSASGHPIYSSVIARSMQKIKNSRVKAGEHRLQAPLRSDNWEKARKVNVADLWHIGSWELLPESHQFMKMFSGFMPQIYRVLPGAKLRFSFIGTTLGIYDVVGPASGKIRLTIDGQVKDFTRFDKYCTYNRLGYGILVDQLENRRHTVELEVLDERLDKGNILQAGDKSFYEANKELYDRTEYYVGSILLVGTIDK